tara:strand:- start:16 stop:852 length:837 start_codon:yes stop_codon:yes gene_type:complete
MGVYRLIRLNLVFALPILFSSICCAQSISFSGSRSQGLANASVCLKDVFSYHNNPANLADQSALSFGLAYENRFLLKELQHQSYALAMPLGRGVFSVGGNSFGYRDFRTFKNGIGYAMELLDALSVGVQINHQMIRISGPYGSNQTLTGELGLAYEVSKNWRFGLAVFNLGRNMMVEEPRERYATSIRLGTAYKVSPMVLIVAELEKDILHPMRYKSGIEYQPSQNLLFRVGFATHPIELSFGLGWVFSSQYHLDFGTQYHQILGWSPNLSFRFDLNK